MRRLLRVFGSVAALVFLAVACGGEDTPADASRDAAEVDASTDASTPDAARDTAVPDGGADSALADGAVADGGPTDAGSTSGLHAFPTSVRGRTLPYYGTTDVRVGHPTATRAVLVVHGTNRNADDYFDRMVAATEMAGVTDETVVLAPHFVIADDTPSSDTLFWNTNGGWKRGDLSTDTLATRVSSFVVVDEMLLALADRSAFPALSTVVVAGHSAGGQFVQRYALGGAADISAASLSFRYVPANPSSYAYLDARRSIGGSTTAFGVPSMTCASYDEWKYGLADLNAHMSDVGAATARSRYAARHVTYLLGEDDDDPAASDLDLTCAAALQGDSRFSRGRIFFGHVEDHYGRQPHSIVTVPGVGHSSTRMFRSPEARAVLFGD